MPGAVVIEFGASCMTLNVVLASRVSDRERVGNVTVCRVPGSGTAAQLTCASWWLMRSYSLLTVIAAPEET